MHTMNVFSIGEQDEHCLNPPNPPTDRKELHHDPSPPAVCCCLGCSAGIACQERHCQQNSQIEKQLRISFFFFFMVDMYNARKGFSCMLL